MNKTRHSLHLGIFVLTMFLASCATISEPDFKITDTKTGTGTEAVTGNWVAVQYTGWLYDSAKPNHKGRRFDRSEPDKPLIFQLGAGKVIKGWEQGVAGMKVGGQRNLIIPSDLGYGQRGAGDRIPPDSTLMFDIELIDVRK
jgi:FKBP-type peptidyl-prolyl cis-trans isomerase FkpA